MSKKMKCPYQTITTHKPECVDGYVKEFAQDIVEFGNCIKSECPFYYVTTSWELNTVEHCHKAESEGKE